MGYFKELQIKRRESKIFRSLCPRCKVWNNNIDIEIIRAPEWPRCFNCRAKLIEFEPVVEEYND